MSDRPEAGSRFAILGPLVVLAGNEQVDPGPYKQRVLLGMLLLRANTVVSVDQLLGAVWPEGLPRTARKNLQVYVSTLRRIVGDRIRHASYGYVLDAGPDELDALRFDDLTARGYAAYREGNLHESRGLLGRAVGLWRDGALVDLAGNPVIAADAEHLGQRYLAAFEDWVDLEIDEGNHLSVLAQLTGQARRHPFRERLIAATITALHRAGRRREALATFEAHRQLVARELGVAPSQVLQQLYRSILVDGAEAATPSGSGPGRVRPAQLPRDVSEFAGRAEHVNALVETLTGSHGTDVAVVTGAVGTGKTALAVRAGRRMAGSFADGEIFVSLRQPDGRPRSVRDVLTELLRATGLDASVPRDEHEAPAAWRSWIADREFLIILDDAVGEDQVRCLLPGNGRNRMLVTSSYRLSGLESVYRVTLDEMTDDEAGELLTGTLGQHRTASGPLQRILRRAGATPLVVRAVSTRLDALRHLSMDEYADLLESAPSVFDELPLGGTPIRERVARVYADLPEPQRRAVRVLGGLPAGPVYWSELVAACSTLFPAAAEVVHRLVEANIVAASHTCAVRYTVPALVRHFAADLSR